MHMHDVGSIDLILVRRQRVNNSSIIIASLQRMTSVALNNDQSALKYLYILSLTTHRY